MADLVGGTPALLGMPPHDWPKLHDPVPHAQVVLQDLAAEAIQLLEHANLIRPKFSYQGAVAGFGYITTRRDALRSKKTQSGESSLEGARSPPTELVT